MSWRKLQLAACCLGLLLTGPAAAQTIFSATPWESPAGGGSALGDYDNDGWPDVFRAENRGYRVALMHNEGEGAFALAAQTRSIQEALPPGKRLGLGQSFADFDNDGDLDLLVPVGNWDYNQRARNVLLRNDRGVFTDVTLAAGLTDINSTDNVVWFDYDRDGYLDVYMGNMGCGTPEQPVFNLLYRNKGDGTFEDVTEGAGLGLQLGTTEAGGCAGGSNGGMAGADFNDDGWPDLYIAVFRSPNRLFLNDGQGHFRDATTPEIADPGQAFDVAVGDIDNDGDLDLFQAAGGAGQTDRSLLLLNLGQGQFLDITEGAGINVVGDAQDTGFGDIDNDGDLDLTLGYPHHVFLNDGNGFFTDGTVQAMGESAADNYIPVAFWDYDLDGHLDGQGYRAFFHNQGNANHSLRVELVGIKSNRNGIGARLFATSGELRQMREILGGRGFNEDELVAHFGLGEHTKVDRLEVRWPSGQVDMLTDLPADQKIRVFEGRAGYQVVKPSVWIKTFPDSLVAGKSFSGVLALRPALFEEGARITRVVADLSELGGPAAAPLQAADDGTWGLETTLKLPDAYGPKTVSVLIDQQTSLGPYWVQLSSGVLLLPAEDEVVFADQLGEGWQPGPPEKGGEKLGFVTWRDGAPELNLIDADGTHQVRLTYAGLPINYENFGFFQHNWDWSPDGKRIVFAGLIEEHRALYLIDVDGTHRQQLTFPVEGRSDVQPAWSPDGKRIAFSSDRPGDFQIYVMDADGSDLVNLTNHPSVNGNPAWSPDGRKIAFDSNRDEPDGGDIYVMEADGSNPVKLTNHPGLNGNPSWSPDGKRIAFVTTRDGRFNIYVMDADGSHPTSLNTPGFDFTPSWSPDGTRIAFWGGMISGLDGSGPVQVILNPAFGAIPNWLPKGAPSPVQVLNNEVSAVTYQGRQARQLRAEKPWLATYQPETPVVPTGYAALSFAFHPGNATRPEGGWFKLRVNDQQLDLLNRIALDREEWQEVEIPLEEFALDRPIGQLEFSGLLQGTFYLADLRLVTAASLLPATVVEEERTTALPQTFALSQNFPNPFNSDTAIRFALPESGEVELAVYDIAGQQVVKLAEGAREAGAYTLRWDGRDGRGKELASGIYLYRLRAGERMETRKLVLVR